VREPGQFVTGEIAGEPYLIVRGADRVLRAFFNVCRHHAAAVVTEAEGQTEQLRCPYHGWTYALSGELVQVPQFAGVKDFTCSAQGLVPIVIEEFNGWLFARLSPGNLTLGDFLGRTVMDQLGSLGVEKFHWLERRRYLLQCNWKVFVDNYLDGGYHVPHLHAGLNSVLTPGKYSIDVAARYCLQSSPMVPGGAPTATSAVRKGEQAFYYWLYPNFMINCYAGVMDTHLVLPLGVDRCEVIFDFYFADLSASAMPANRASMAVSEQIQNEDAAICASVQRGLGSRSYSMGRLSVQREAGEHLFHKLLHGDLRAGLTDK
jgi:choline monooxygenase